MFIFYLYAAILLGVLIIVHEVGHFIAARIARVTVERFSIGFGPRVLTKKRGDTEYALSLIPLGGYVKMAGMDPGDLEEGMEDRTDTFLSKPIALRAFIVVSGPVTNFVWAILVSVAVLWFAGLPTLGEAVIGEIEAGSRGDTAGLVAGDRIVSVGGVPVTDWEEVIAEVAEQGEGPIELLVQRGGVSGRELPVSIGPPADAEDGLDLGVTAYVPPILGDVLRGGPADRAGLEPGDEILSVAGQEVGSWYELGDLVRARADQETEIIWKRDGETMSAVVVPEEGEEAIGTTEVQRVGLIGIMRTWSVRKLGLGEAITTGFRISLSNLKLMLEFFWGLARGQVPTAMLGGPIRIVQLASESARWGASYFFGFMAFLSLNLFLVNLLPLPILDGGHLVLLGLEKVRRRRITDRALLVWQQVGLIFFVSLMIVLLVMDAIRVI